jgi:hypothetical protein
MRFDPQAMRSLVDRDRVHRSLYLDPDVFELEMAKIFGRSWVYVGPFSPPIGICSSRSRQAVRRRLESGLRRYRQPSESVNGP